MSGRGSMIAAGGSAHAVVAAAKADVFAESDASTPPRRTFNRSRPASDGALPRMSRAQTRIPRMISSNVGRRIAGGRFNWPEESPSRRGERRSPSPFGRDARGTGSLRLGRAAPLGELDHRDTKTYSSPPFKKASAPPDRAVGAASNPRVAFQVSSGSSRVARRRQTGGSWGSGDAHDGLAAATVESHSSGSSTETLLSLSGSRLHGRRASAGDESLMAGLQLPVLGRSQTEVAARPPATKRSTSGHEGVTLTPPISRRSRSESGSAARIGERRSRRRVGGVSGAARTPPRLSPPTGTPPLGAGRSTGAGGIRDSGPVEAAVREQIIHNSPRVSAETVHSVAILETTASSSPSESSRESAATHASAASSSQSVDESQDKPVAPLPQTQARRPARRSQGGSSADKVTQSGGNFQFGLWNKVKKRKVVASERARNSRMQHDGRTHQHSLAAVSSAPTPVMSPTKAPTPSKAGASGAADEPPQRMGSRSTPLASRSSEKSGARGSTVHKSGRSKAVAAAAQAVLLADDAEHGVPTVAPSPAGVATAATAAAAPPRDNAAAGAHDPSATPPLTRRVVSDHKGKPPAGPTPDSGERRHGRKARRRTKLNWRRGTALGSGTYGQVFTALNEDSGALFAVKQVKAVNAEEATALESEVRLMKSLQQAHIVQYLGAERETGFVNIFMELVPGGSIATLLRTFGPLREPVIRRYTRQILIGVAYLHSKGVVHRDIKGGNVLVSDHGTAKLADFGCATKLHGLLTSSLDDSLRAIRGSVPWMAPEVIRQTGGGRLADIWSVGATVIEMATAQRPWPHLSNNLTALFHVATCGKSPPFPDQLSDEGKDFLRCCCDPDPTKRWSAARLLTHPFVKGTECHCGCEGPMAKDDLVAEVAALAGSLTMATTATLRSTRNVTQVEAYATAGRVRRPMSAHPSPARGKMNASGDVLAATAVPERSVSARRSRE